MKSFASKYTRIYVNALFLVGAFTIGSQLFLQLYLLQVEHDSHVINIAGRQRMLSQKISKEALLMRQTNNEPTYNQHQQNLATALELWERSHNGLQKGDSSLNLPEPKLSQTNLQYFKQIEPHRAAICQATKRLLEVTFVGSSDSKQTQVAQILAHENQFLTLMNKITFEFDTQSKSSIQVFKWVEIILLSVTLLILAFEGLYIFRPAFKKINESVVELQENSEEIDAQNQMLSMLYEDIRQQNKNMLASINYAQTIQSASLSLDANISSYINKDLFILFKPRDIVSGDFYYLAETNSHYIVAAVDCQGHGIPGGFLSMIGVSIMNDIVKVEKITDPGEILNRAHQKIRRTLKQDETDNRDTMDLSLISKPKNKNEVQFAGAKNSIIYISNNELCEQKGERFSIGGHQNTDCFTTYTIPYEKDTMVYLFSDGYLDQFGGEHKRKFMKARFKEILLQNYQKTLVEQQEILDTTLDDWMKAGNEAQIDDILVMGVNLEV